MKKKCRNCSQSFTVRERDLEFYEKVSPTFNEVKYQIPPPTLCPRCRLQRRMAYRNQIYVFLRPSSQSGKQIFSGYPEESPFPVYTSEEWWSDSWDGKDFGFEPDFSKSVFEQLEVLNRQVPWLALSGAVYCENSEYCNNYSHCKNCYMTFNTSYAEDCAYCENAYRSRDCYESTFTTHSELCYDCVFCARCYNLQSSWQCEDCSDSYFLLNCRSCRDCFGCVNLRHRSHCVFNEQLSKEDYQRFIEQFEKTSYSERSEYKKRAFDLWQKHPRPHAILRNTENVTGSYLENTKNVFESFFVRDGEDMRYCFNVQEGAKDCFDYSFPGIRVELMYESSVCAIDDFYLLFCTQCLDGCNSLIYCINCQGSKNCFASVGLKKGEYCIFNKQYSKEEYNILVPKLIEHMRQTGEWGEHIPMSMSPHAYNISIAQRYFPLNKEQAEQKGLRWHKHQDPTLDQAIESEQLPDKLPIDDTPITTRSIISGRPFRISALEIKKCRMIGAPLPRMTYDERMEGRAKLLGGIDLFKRQCQKSEQELLTTYEPESTWIIWEKDTYEKEFGS